MNQNNPELRWIAIGILGCFVVFSMYVIGQFMQSAQAEGARLMIAYGGAACIVICVPAIAIIAMYHIHKSFQANEIPVPRRKRIAKKKEN